ncbi:DUF5819 family protein [Streptomyces longispororuber]|uniref:DUF5819 family protein n=1 Tax=Streptomyces longispororuber TaxID=68230 RepID=UPI0033F559C0
MSSASGEVEEARAAETASPARGEPRTLPADGITPAARQARAAGAPGGWPAAHQAPAVNAPARPPAADTPVRPPAAGAPSGFPVPEWPGSASAPGTPAAPLGIAGLPRRYQVVAVLALAAIAATVCVHLGMMFLHVAPANTVSKKHGETIDKWVYPEFEQNWKLFAPNPLQQNVSVQARAKLRTADGGHRVTPWYDLSAQDGAAIDHNPLPSHTQQNELRRAWDFFLSTHDAQNRPTGPRGEISERYIRRVVLLRIDRQDPLARGETIDQVQIRSRTTAVRPPEWSDENVSTKPVVRLLPWWSVIPDDLPLADDARASRDVAAEGSAR